LNASLIFFKFICKTACFFEPQTYFSV